MTIEMGEKWSKPGFFNGHTDCLPSSEGMFIREVIRLERSKIWKIST